MTDFRDIIIIVLIAAATAAGVAIVIWSAP
jgi:hypothetical protein